MIVSLRISPVSSGAASRSSASVFAPSMANTSLAKRGSRCPITAVDREHGAIKQIVDRRAAINGGVAVLHRPVVAHVNIVSSPSAWRTESRWSCCLATWMLTIG